MKKITYRQAALVCLAALICFTLSCRDKREKEVFEKPAAERIQQGINALREKLKASPQGWIISYKPSSKETGYYQFLFRFVNDTEVETASDFSRGNLNWKKSEYAILTGSTTKLSFSTGSPLHQLSDADFSPIPNSNGSGLKGDFEFLYCGENDQGNLIFKTNRTNEILLFKKAAKNSPDDLKVSYGYFEKVRESQSVYRSLFELKDDQLKQSLFSFPYDAHVIKIQGLAEKEGKEKTVKFDVVGYITGYGLTPEGVFLDSVRRNNGQVLKNIQLKYNKEANRFETLLGDGTLLALGDAKAPIIPVDGQKVFLDPSLTASLDFYSGNDGGTTTPAFNALFDKLFLNGLVNPPGFSLFRQAAYDGVNKIDYSVLPGTASESDGAIRERLIYEEKGGRLVITRNGFVDSDSRVKPANELLYNEFMNVLTDPQGFYVENLGIIIVNGTNDILTFTSARDPAIRIGFYRTKPNP